MRPQPRLRSERCHVTAGNARPAPNTLQAGCGARVSPSRLPRPGEAPTLPEAGSPHGRPRVTSWEGTEGCRHAGGSRTPPPAKRGAVPPLDVKPGVKVTPFFLHFLLYSHAKVYLVNTWVESRRSKVHVDQRVAANVSTRCLWAPIFLKVRGFLS